jgi:DNA-binding CsgD family transcriptional regulator
MLATRKVFFPLSSAGFEDSFVFVASSFGALCLALLLSGIVLRKRWADSITPGKGFALSSLSVLGTLIFFGVNAVPGLDTAFILHVIAGILTGVGSGCLLMLWGVTFGSMDQPSAMSNTSFALLLAFALYYICVGFIDYPVLTAIVVVIPFAEGALLALSLNSSLHTITSYTAEIKADRVSFSLRIGILVVVIGFALSVLRELSIASIPAEAQGNEQMVILIGSLVLALFIIHIILFSEQKNQRKYRLQIPVLFVATAVLLLLLIGDESSLLYKIILLISYFCFEVTVWSAFVWIVYHCRLSPFGVFGLGLGGLFIGQFISPLSNHFVTLSGSPLALNQVVEPIVLMFILLLAIWLLSNEKGLPGIVLPVNSENSDATPDEENVDLGGAIDAAAKLYQLSDKETEVLTLLTKGRSVAHISKKLYISNNTSKTHIRRIYTKMNVHSKEELMDLVDGIEGHTVRNR